MFVGLDYIRQLPAPNRDIAGATFYTVDRSGGSCGSRSLWRTIQSGLQYPKLNKVIRRQQRDCAVPILLAKLL